MTRKLPESEIRSTIASLVNSWYKDFNWLAVLTESVYKLELHAATASVRRCVVTETLTLDRLLEG